MGRPSLLDAEMEGGRVRVSGAAIPLIEGTVELPELEPRSRDTARMHDCDAIVVGAGLSGLAAARELGRAGSTCGCWRRATGSAGAP